MSVSDTIAELTKTVTDLYKELVTNSVRFEELRRQTGETIGEFKHALERLADKVETIQRDRIETEAALKAEIQLLQGRLDMLSERALHVAVKDAAREVAEERMRNYGVGASPGKSEIVASMPGSLAPGTSSVQRD